MISSQQTVQLSRDQSCPLSSGPESGVFLQHLCGTTKAQDRHQQGSVFNIIMAAVKTAPHGTEGTGGAALRHGGEEANRAHLCTQPGGHMKGQEGLPGDTAGRRPTGHTSVPSQEVTGRDRRGLL